MEMAAIPHALELFAGVPRQHRCQEDRERSCWDYGLQQQISTFFLALVLLMCAPSRCQIDA